MDAESQDSDGRESLARRACDQCRQRKIRCDKRSPCSNCRTSKILCSSTGAGQKPREPRKRVLISNEYEKKIDNIDERLGGIEQVLRDLKASLASGNGSRAPMYHHATPVSRHISPSVQDSKDAMDQQEAKGGFEGNSLMATQSAYASNFLQTAVSRSPLQMSVSKINTALSTLKQLVNFQDSQDSSARELRFSKKQQLLSGCDPREFNMPPVDVVLPVLRRAKESYGAALQSYCPFIPIDRLTDKCREIYFATEDYSDATFITVNGGLYQLFVAASFMTQDRAVRQEYQGYVDMCKNNLETTLANLHLLMPANFESIEALTLGASHAIEISKPSFALTLTSTASRLAQALGYHQWSSYENLNIKEQERRLGIFWSIYCMDRALALRLGRASTIPDYDIDLPTSFDGFAVAEPWKTAFTLWIELARIQALVYEKLYCPAALRQSEVIRVTEARKLAAQMQDRVMQPFERIYPLLGDISPVDALYIRCDEVCRLSVLCLIYRAIPPATGTPGTFISECVDAARGALQAHKSCMLLIKEATPATKLSYFHWSILYSPFVPFIVLFCHIIEVSSWVDLDRLDEFVASLQSNCSLSTAIAKLHRLCQVLSNVARLYIEAKSQLQSQENQDLASVGHEFDTYLSALGLAPVVPEAGAGWAGVPVSGVGTTMPGEVRFDAQVQVQAQAQSQQQQQHHHHHTHAGPQMPHMTQTQLGNWFSGNQLMMGLLEEDLSMFDPSNLAQWNRE
ncbi:hypothetical protein BJY04DRAFT_99373 [Aspergillus karnatakaensis]|uniref:putative C6 transcription factor n=1 Tax=Aspergillus karnatakaensis TaxID=1810916 RepID=UPI003CCD20A6